MAVRGVTSPFGEYGGLMPPVERQEETEVDKWGHSN